MSTLSFLQYEERRLEFASEFFGRKITTVPDPH